MNATAKPQKMNWMSRSAHQWLEQYGLWVRSTKIKVSANPLAILIDKNDKTRLRTSRISIPCDLTDFEGVEISKLLAKMHNDKREYLSERGWLLILKYENDWSYQTIANTHKCSKATVRREIDLGLAYLDGLIELKSEV
ncbi:antitermination protein [Acinetobacter sp. 2JN-4]|uniref:antiterminator Q family protein n=1 Tax=Acinetobacter sp. 2JN-4 TaxID=2479844 RepID=UPI000EF97D44|nr:antiterminator Q family protein [Acinetobacter sp. 2JN-4]RLZ06845.1 antitermination protein [Acinetobacter sp. 2JN-4]